MGEAAYRRPLFRGPESSDPDRDAYGTCLEHKPERVCVGPARYAPDDPSRSRRRFPLSAQAVTRNHQDRCQLLFALDRGAKTIDSGTTSAITRPSRTRSPFKRPSDKRFLASSRRTRRAGRDDKASRSSSPLIHLPHGLSRQTCAPVDLQPPHRPRRGRSLCDALQNGAFAGERFGLRTTGTL
jgi:hypothetical protein